MSLKGWEHSLEATTSATDLKMHCSAREPWPQKWVFLQSR